MAVDLMAIKPITQIPNNEPDAVPALWNFRYDEIDKNFEELDARTIASGEELLTARGEKESVGDRLHEMATQLLALSPEFQADLAATLMMALDQAGVANKSVQDLKGLSQQEGLVLIKNRGIVSGCTATKSETATRNLNLVGGIVFVGGRRYSAPSATNAASVPPNTTSASVTVQAYLYMHTPSDTMRLAVTNIGQKMPENTIHLYNVTIPAGSTDATDPRLANVTISNVRRVEPMFPRSFNSPVTLTVPINTLRNTDYRIDFDVVSFDGGACDLDQIVVNSRAQNGFSFYLASECDNVVLRWRVSKLNN